MREKGRKGRREIGRVRIEGGVGGRQQRKERNEEPKEQGREDKPDTRTTHHGLGESELLTGGGVRRSLAGLLFWS